MVAHESRSRMYRAWLHRIRWPLLGLLLLTAWASIRATLHQPSVGCFLGQATAGSARSAAYCWGVIGNDGTHLAEERRSGITAKMLRLSWSSYMPLPGTPDRDYRASKHAELAELRAAGFAVILNLGMHNPPDWIHDGYPDSRYINQYGEAYRGDDQNNGDLNIIFNPALRALTADYVQTVFSEFGSDFAGVRLGGGRFGELTYPPASYDGHENVYWAFDRNALAQSPVPDWRPGAPSPRGEAAQFLDWYLDALVEFQNWQIATVRQNYSGPLLMLYPSWGIRPGQIERALAGNLDGSTAAERNGEIQRGFDFARQIAALRDPDVIVTTTWLDADASADDKPDPRYWSPVKYLASLTARHPLKLQLFGENTGQGQIVEMELSALQMRRYGLRGMFWYREEELFSGQYATLADYQQTIAHTPVGD